MSSGEPLCAECHHSLSDHGAVIEMANRIRVNACGHIYHQGWFRTVTCRCTSFRRWPVSAHDAPLPRREG